MELKAMELEAGLLDRPGPSDQKLETKTEANKDSKEYCKLNSPADDIYSEAVFPSPKLTEVKPTKPTRSRKDVLPALCIVLGVICLAELITIFILNGKTPPTPVCRDCCSRSAVFSRSLCMKNLNTQPAKSLDSHRCPDGWVFFKDFCFYLSKERKIWKEGRTVCQNLTGDLAVISNENEDFLTEQIKVAYWIGLQYETSWEWINGQTYNGKLTEGARGSCALLESKTHGSWRTGSCFVHAHFICQKKAS